MAETETNGRRTIDFDRIISRYSEYSYNTGDLRRNIAGENMRLISSKNFIFINSFINSLIL